MSVVLALPAAVLLLAVPALAIGRASFVGIVAGVAVAAATRGSQRAG